MVQLRSTLIGIAGSLALVTEARAEPSATVLLAGSCTPAGASAPEILRILDSEIAPLHVAPLTTTEEARDADAVLGLSACGEDPPTATLFVFRGGERRQRVVSLADAEPGERDRVLALALAEALRDPATTRASEGPPPPWLAPAPAVAPVLLTTARDTREPSQRSHDRPTALRTAVLFRYVPVGATPVLGVGAGIDWRRMNAGIRVLAAHASDPLGEATLLAIAGSAAFDAIELLPEVSLRAEGELGAGLGMGSPGPSAVGRTQAALHAALFGGIAGALALGAGYELQGFVAGGYATSIDAGADGRRIATLGGAQVSLEIALRFP